MVGGTAVEWVPGLSPRWWSAGFLMILWGAVAVALLVTSLRGFWQHGQLTGAGFLVYFGIAGAISIPGILAYSFLVPTTARLGITTDGVIVEAVSAKYRYGFRQGYRWGDLQLRDGLLLLPRIRPRAPRSLRLTATQLARIAPRIRPG